jgi:GNAT superfamily N-acetyltransferase
MKLSDDRFTLLGSRGGTWLAVQRIRLVDVDDAVKTVRAFMERSDTKLASWWLSEHSTPDDVEMQLRTRGLRIVDDDYLIDGMLITTPPPRAPSHIVARAVAGLDEYLAAAEAQWEAFGTPDEQRRDAAKEYEVDRRGGVVVHYAAWLDGEIVGGGRSVFTPRGVLMSGGATVPAARGRGVYRALVRARWDDAVARGTAALAVQAGAKSAPILARLGFEPVCRFRRLQDDRRPS